MNDLKQQQLMDRTNTIVSRFREHAKRTPYGIGVVLNYQSDFHNDQPVKPGAVLWSEKNLGKYLPIITDQITSRETT